MYKPKKINLPENGGRVLLHSCCAPCSGAVIEALHAAAVDFSIYFYNPNIHPRDEYEKRKSENARYAAKMGIPFIDADYDPENWLARVKGLENEPERGQRCTECFGFRFERSALYAHENGFPILTSCFAISRWKDRDQVNACAKKAVARYLGLVYWDIDWRKQGRALRMIDLAKQENFYQQAYCGCVFSLRNSHKKNSAP